MILYGSSDDNDSTAYHGNDHCLALLITPIVNKMMHIKGHHSSIAIDVVHEHSFPASEAHCHSLASLGNTLNSCLNGKHLSHDLASGGKLKISLSPSISSINQTDAGLHISYKRSF